MITLEYSSTVFMTFNKYIDKKAAIMYCTLVLLYSYDVRSYYSYARSTVLYVVLLYNTTVRTVVRTVLQFASSLSTILLIDESRPPPQEEELHKK
jgi:hypothetical protein